MLEKRKLVDEFTALVRIDSESRHEKACALHVARRLEELGASVEFDDAAKAVGGDSGNLIARLPGRAPEEDNDFFGAPLLLTAHLDTVPPGTSIHPKIRNEVITSAGETVLGADDKAGVAIVLQVLEVLKARELPHPPLEIVFTVCEEEGLAGSRELDFSKLEAKHGISLDASTLGAFTIAAPYKSILDIEVGGIASHAAQPLSGINAIQVAAQAVSKMRMGHVDDETTCNVGSFVATGPINVVRDRASLQIEVRSRSEEKMQAQVDHINRCLREGAASFVASLPEGERRPVVSAVTRKCYDGFRIAPDNPFVVRLTEAAERLDIEPTLHEGMGGTDANNFFIHGITVIDMGVGIANAHTTRESLRIYDLFKAARLLVMIVSGR